MGSEKMLHELAGRQVGVKSRLQAGGHQPLCPDEGNAFLRQPACGTRFAQRVAQISNRITRNEELDLPALVRRLKAENQLLRQELQLVQSCGANSGRVAAAVGGLDTSADSGSDRASTGEGPPASMDQHQHQQLDVGQRLSEGERQRLAAQLRAYLADPSPDAVPGLQASMRVIAAAFSMLKAILLGGTGPTHRRAALIERLGGSNGEGGWGRESESDPKEEAEADDAKEAASMAARVQELQQALQQKQRELDVLVGVLHKQGLLPTPGGAGSTAAAVAANITGLTAINKQQPVLQHSPAGSAMAGSIAQSSSLPLTTDMLRDQNKAFDYFCASSPAHDTVQEHKALLRSRIEGARALGERVTASKQRVAALKSRLEAHRLQRSMAALLSGSGTDLPASTQEDAEEAAVRREIDAERTAYRDAVAQLREMKQEVEQLQAVLEHRRARLQQDFQAWWRIVSSAAAGAGGGDRGGDRADDWRIAAMQAASLAVASPDPVQPLMQQFSQAQQPPQQHSSSAAGQPSFAGWVGPSMPDPNSRPGIGPETAAAAVSVQRRRSSICSSRSSMSQPPAGWSSTQQQAAAGLPTAAIAPLDPPEVQPAAAAATPALAPPPDPLSGVDPEVLAAARPLLTGDPGADADIVRFYQARAALLAGRAGR